MAQVRVGLVTGFGGIQAAVPTFTEIPGSYQGITAGVATKDGVLVGVPLGDARLQNVTVLVEVPDADTDGKGNLDPVAIKRRYPDHPLVKAGRFG